ncbi:efflux RND transporter periplasmic adaptor subunit [Niabella drilacis]|uniref:Membrane fusion protein, multidrug efflux system n=1 Tax=Niabella drilacis (strain DSM 25811 / CCM 8410 / CCUG 62505 / LMG 26954 / E90) TaxID=1285928 RepID=A0A1G6HXU1_NIADE|nr:efflux RND transporter periplasmic adaptor subunit [Niabella drilacis]SDB99092.1 membrane fusion protein, multidrug efflux system [Niabella drilacis]
MTKRTIVQFIFIVIFIAACKGNSQQHNPATTRGKEYPVLSVTPRDTLLSIPYVAHLQAGRNIEIHSRTEGLLDKIYIKEGQQVRKGQLLFKMNDSELRIELNKAAAAYKSAVADAKVAQVETERVQVLVDKKVITKTELDLVTAKYRALLAKADVALADKNAVQQRISYTNITAPFDGIVDRIPLKEGSLITTASLLTTISDISTVFAYFNISENEYFQTLLNGNNAQQITSISLVLPDGTSYPHNGVLESAESEIDERTGNIAYKARFGNPEKMLRHGASGKLLITRPLQNVILLPQKTVFEIQDKNYVFVVDQGNIARMKHIRVDQRLADYYVVSGGLSANDRIVYEGIQTIREGDRISPKG